MALSIKKHIDFEKIVKVALGRAYEAHQKLGPKGEEKIRKNQFGETALRLDMEAEEVIIKFLQQEQIPIKIISEEHGVVDVVSQPRLLGILDGLDGSNRYLAGRGSEKYGTMFAVFSNLNPVYGDYLTSGIMEHSTGRLFLANHKAGASMISGDQGKSLKTSGQKLFNEKARIYLNEHWQVCQEVFAKKLKGNFQWSDPRSYAAYFSDLASGNVDLVLTCTGKNNLELAIGFGLINEAGGIITDLRGNGLKGEKYLEFGQRRQLPVVIASTQELAKEFTRYLGP